RLYIARAPLYLLRNGNNSRYAYTEAERERVMKAWKSKGKVTIQRYKGLGEMNPGQLRETIFKQGDPDPWFNEHMVRVTVNDVHAANTTMSLWMGGSPTQRREHLMTYWDGDVVENGADD
ncbi:MAG: hypothetical protein JXC32_20215, partial [Anaerolineae bacterium]|nr:hypothetical protein [Anaerolineae bacterium]